MGPAAGALLTGEYGDVPGAVAEAVDGNAPGELGKIRGKHRRPLGRYGIPGGEVCIVDALPAVLHVREDVAGNFGQVAVIFGLGLLNGGFVPVPVQCDDLFVFHLRHSFLYSNISTNF